MFPAQPQTPNGFTGANTGPLDIRFEWTALQDSENGIPVRFAQDFQYIVDVRDSGGMVKNTKTVSHPTNYTVITNLTSCTNFTATLVAVNVFSTSNEAMVAVDTFDTG